MSKRTRYEQADSEVYEAAHQLEGALSRGQDSKLQALDMAIGLVDHADETYTAQRALVDADAVFFLVELLQDASDAVSLKAAQAVRLITQHSAPAIARLSAGPLLGLDSTVSRVLLNPVQAAFIDCNVAHTLVDWLLGRQEHKKREALDTMSALCSYNHDGKVAFLERLTHAFCAGQLQVRI
jgi:hypothetical protein